MRSNGARGGGGYGLEQRLCWARVLPKILGWFLSLGANFGAWSSSLILYFYFFGISGMKEVDGSANLSLEMAPNST